MRSRLSLRPNTAITDLQSDGGADHAAVTPEGELHPYSASHQRMMGPDNDTFIWRSQDTRSAILQCTQLALKRALELDCLEGWDAVRMGQEACAVEVRSGYPDVIRTQSTINAPRDRILAAAQQGLGTPPGSDCSHKLQYSPLMACFMHLWR